MYRTSVSSRLAAKAARFTQSNSRRILIGAAVFFVVAGAVGFTAFRALDPYEFEDPGTQSAETTAALEEATGLRADGSVIALVEANVRSEAGRRRIAEVTRELGGVSGVKRSVTALAGGRREMISHDGRRAYVVGAVAAGVESRDIAEDAEATFAGQHDVALGGIVMADHQIAEQSEADLRRAELLAFPLLALLSLLFFRGAVAAMLPLAIGTLAIVGALLAMRLIHEVTSLSVLSINIVTGLGLGLGIDYSLFIVSRFREELAGGATTGDALQRTLATAGKAVAFSGLTVACAMTAMLVMPHQFLYSMGLGGIAVALLSATAALVVLPAILALLGPRVNALAPAWLQRSRRATDLPDRDGGWYRFAAWVMRRPLLIAIVASAVLILMTLPAMRIDFVPADAGLLQSERSAGVVDATIAREFASDPAYPLIVRLAVPPGETAQIRAYRASLRRLPGVTDVSAPTPAGKATRIDLVTNRGRYSTATREVVREIRTTPAPGPVQVGGIAASAVDEEQSVASHLPLAAAILVISTLILLFLMTGSVVLPVKALLMNALSIGAALGLLVLVFQDGRLETAFAFTGQGGILIGIAVLIVVTAFGLSTDYGVFTLSRIREGVDQGLSNAEAVSLGLERTGRLVTSAALLFSVAMGALVSGTLIGVKETGLGLAAAVLIDATIVRALLVPSLMALLGSWNWWAPKSLRRARAELPIGPPPWQELL